MDTEFLKDLPSGPLDVYRKQSSFHWKDMKLVFEDPELLKIKMKMWETMENDPIFQRRLIEPTAEEMKMISAKQLHRYLQYNFFPKNISSFPYKRKTRYMMTVNEGLAQTFPDVSVKHAVGIGLFKNTLGTLGTERHQQVLDAAWNNKIVACIGLTEVAHGSNTKQMRTTATYDKATQEFVIHTPDFQAAKCWAGNLGKTCTMGLVFAQLITNNQNHGLHAFLVPIRDPRTLLPYHGITVGDIGEKIGLHGIDNGFMLFDNYRIPRENLLNRTADVTPDGEYESSFSEPGKILGAALENLSTGRVGIMQESVNSLGIAVTIAIRYAATRKQFADNGNGEEIPLIEYQLHQWRLFPHVSAAAVLKMFTTSFTDVYLHAVEKSTSSDRLDELNNLVSEVHAIISCAKPLITWSCQIAAQECREACGGHGFLRAARLGELRSANDPRVTYEGDNNVLIQQTSNWLLRQWRLRIDTGAVASPLGSCSFFMQDEEIQRRRFRLRDVKHPQFIQECYEWLLIYLVQETHGKLTLLEDQGDSKFTARNKCQVYLAAALSLAYAELTALRHFWSRIEKVDSKLRTVLEKFGSLYGLANLEKHIAYFYQGGFCEGDARMAQLIKDSILGLCEEVKPEVVTFIDALAPTDFVVNSVLGNSDGQLYDNLKNLFYQNANLNSRPTWWSEVIIPGAPDIKKISKSKL